MDLFHYLYYSLLASRYRFMIIILGFIYWIIQ